LWDESGKLEAVAMTEPEITVKEQTEAALLKAHDNLEKGVRTRTAELQQANEEVLIEKEFLRITLECIGDAVITTDVAGKITYLNPVAEQLTGWDNVEATGLPLLDVFKILGESTRQPAESPVEKCLRDGQVRGLSNDTLLIRRDGQELSIDDTAAPIRSRTGEILGAVLIFRDVTKRRGATKQLAYQAVHDPLTGLSNRREFERRLKRVLSSCGADQSHVLLYLDLDEFKIVNDTCGHVAGDEVLRRVSSLLRSGIRVRDTLARLGGDEFGILFEHCSKERGLLIALSLVSTIQDFRFVWEDKSFNIGMSIGLVPISQGDNNLSSILNAADSACYSAKKKGHNRVQIYQADDGVLALGEGEIQRTSQIKQAFAKERFRLFYQPIIALGEHGSKTEQGEILLRLLDGEGELVLPGAFIPVAERYKQMLDIDRWVVRHSLIALRAHLAHAPITYNINISGQSLCDEKFLAFVIEQLGQTDVPPSSLCFEITETAAIVNLTQAMIFVSTLKKYGCRFALDDFGSGLSSLNYIKALSVDYLKIDASLVTALVKNPSDRSMVETIHNIGHAMGLQSIAEGVEDAATLQMLKEIGVDYAQGYWIGRPEVWSS
jgi:diguanylate cyclase (GGDEF)-like protein/PAS domain S-box-containing protein